MGSSDNDTTDEPEADAESDAADVEDVTLFPLEGDVSAHAVNIADASASAATRVVARNQWLIFIRSSFVVDALPYLDCGVWKQSRYGAAFYFYFTFEEHYCQWKYVPGLFHID